MTQPFETDGIAIGSDGVKRYTDLAQNLCQLLMKAVEVAPHAEALVELGGARISYAELWDRSTRVAGGLRALGVQRGDRVANRLANGNDWVYAF